MYDSESSHSLKISGVNCWEAFAKEAGKHIVQRVPPTESKGRRHTSTVSVAVLPIMQESDTPLCLQEVEIITQCGHGKGGQNQNKVESAVRAIHRPSGISVFINGRDQYRNKQLALEILQARLRQRARDAAVKEHSDNKAAQIGYGDRSGKIRTYNFISSQVTDHRSGAKTHRIDEVMKGKFNLLR